MRCACTSETVVQRTTNQPTCSHDCLHVPWNLCAGAFTRVTRNENFDKLTAGYLFPEVGEPGTRVGCGHQSDVIATLRNRLMHT